MLPCTLLPFQFPLLPDLLRALQRLVQGIQFLRQCLGSPGQADCSDEWNDKSALGFAHGGQP
jgi:hypothetical protein